MIMDVESLRRSGSSRVRCLDVFLVVSIVLLFAAVGVVMVGVMFWMKPPASEQADLCTKTAPSPQPYVSDVVDTVGSVISHARLHPPPSPPVYVVYILNEFSNSVLPLFYHVNRCRTVPSCKQTHVSLLICPITLFF